jgi:hypothetical protein
MTDPAVPAPDITGWFVLAIAVLVAGVVVTVVGSWRPEAPRPPLSA